MRFSLIKSTVFFIFLVLFLAQVYAGPSERVARDDNNDFLEDNGDYDDNYDDANNGWSRFLEKTKETIITGISFVIFAPIFLIAIIFDIDIWPS